MEYRTRISAENLIRYLEPRETSGKYHAKKRRALILLGNTSSSIREEQRGADICFQKSLIRILSNSILQQNLLLLLNIYAKCIYIHIYLHILH